MVVFYMKKNIWNIQKKDHGKKILVFLKENTPELSIKELKWALDHNFCLLNGRPERYSSTLLNEGDFLSLYPIDDFKIASQQFNASSILHEDGDLLVYNKPAFLPSVGPHSLEELLKHERSIIFPVHRLDRDTTGVILFAKNRETQKKIEEVFKKRAVKKSYLAIVTNRPKTPSITIRNYVGEIKKEPGRVTFGVVNRDKGVLAETTLLHLKDLKIDGHPVSLLRCFPLTGRTHQIRVHLKSIGSPILGDAQYSGSIEPYSPHTLLHAESLEIFLNSTLYTFKAPPFHPFFNL